MSLAAIKLSICIPSFNRSKFLPDLLNSILLQYDEGVEVVICDNGSIDDTQAVVLEWMKRCPWIVYERLEKNIGIDLCLAKSVEKASGPYCWLMGDDDILEPNALQIILTRLQDTPTLTGITVNRAAYDSALKTRWMEPDAKKRKEDKLFLEASTCFIALFSLFGFLSAQIVKRELWQSIIKEEEIASHCNAYLLIYIIGRMIQKDPRWLYLHTPCVGWRSDNDSFAKQLGLYGRFKLDLIGYQEVVSSLFSKDDPLYRKILNQICSIHLVAHVRGMKWKDFFKGFRWQSVCLCFPRLKNIPSFWYLLLPTVLAPTWTLRSFRFLFVRFSKIVRSQ